MQTTPSFDFTRYEDQVRRLARRLLGDAPSPAEIAGGMHLLTVATERDLLRFGAVEELGRVACCAGCSACCVLNVAVLIPEAITIAWYLERRLKTEKLAALRDRLRELHVKTRWLDDEERLYLGEPCAFLDPAGWCLIHRVRPLLCRSITSLDEETCRAAVVAVPLAAPPPILMNLFQKGLFDAAYRGLAAGLAELGLDDRPWRLAPAVLCFLSEGEAVSRFVAGEGLACH